MAMNGLVAHHELWKELQRIQRQAAVETPGATSGREAVTRQPWDDFGSVVEFHPAMFTNNWRCFTGENEDA